jgi:hypothetical protein
MEFGESAALLIIVTFPFTLPIVFGAKNTFNTADWPAAMVAPESPLAALKPVPLTVTADTVTLEFPVFLTVTPSSLLPPSASLPKFRLELDNERFLAVVVPVPLMLIVNVGSLPLFLMTMFPVTPPVLVGANVMVKLIVCPEPSQSGIYRSLILNSLPLKVALDITNVALPLFFSWMTCEFFVPTATDPKFALVAVAESVPTVALALPGESVDHKINSTLAMNLKPFLQLNACWELAKWSSWENAEKMASNDLARGPYDCISQSDYSRRIQESTDQQQRIRAKTFSVRTAWYYLFQSTGCLLQKIKLNLRGLNIRKKRF